MLTYISSRIGNKDFSPKGLGKSLSLMERELLSYLQNYGRKVQYSPGVPSDFLGDFVQEAFLAIWPMLKKYLEYGLEYGKDFSLADDTVRKKIGQAARAVRYGQATRSIRCIDLSTVETVIESPYNQEKMIVARERKEAALRCELARSLKREGKFPGSRQIDNLPKGEQQMIRSAKIWIKEQLKMRLLDDVIALLS